MELYETRYLLTGKETEGIVSHLRRAGFSVRQDRSGKNMYLIYKRGMMGLALGSIKHTMPDVGFLDVGFGAAELLRAVEEYREMADTTYELKDAGSA